MIIVADADAIIAQADPNDKHHKTATIISETLISKNAQIIYPATAICEAVTYIQRVLGSSVSAYATVSVFITSNIQVAQVNQNTLKIALKYFGPKTSKKNTLFDCIVAAVAQEYKADAIFSFDRFYQRKGFKLAQQLK